MSNKQTCFALRTLICVPFALAVIYVGCKMPIKKTNSFELNAFYYPVCPQKEEGQCASYSKEYRYLYENANRYYYRLNNDENACGVFRNIFQIDVSCEESGAGSGPESVLIKYGMPIIDNFKSHCFCKKELRDKSERVLVKVTGTSQYPIFKPLWELYGTSSDLTVDCRSMALNFIKIYLILFSAFLIIYYLVITLNLLINRKNDNSDCSNSPRFRRIISEPVDKKMEKESGPFGLLQEIYFNGWQRIVPWILMIIVAVFILVIGIRYFYSGTRVDVKNGIVEIKEFGGDRKFIFALHPAQGWANTGITLARGEELNFSVSGGVNLGFHRIVEAGIFDLIPDQPWIFRPGNAGGNRIADKHRKDAILKPGAGWGSILAYVCCDGEFCPDMDNKKSIEKMPQDRIQIAAEAEMLLSDRMVVSDCRGKLYLTVNENYPVNRDQYVRSSSEYLEDAIERRIKIKQNPAELWRNLEGWAVQANWYSIIGASKDSDVFNACKAPYENSSIGLGYRPLEEPFQKLASILHSGDFKPACNEDTRASGKKETEEYGFQAKDFTDGNICMTGIVKTTEQLMLKDDPSLAALMCVRDAMWWEITVKDYPRLWFDENAGLYLVTIHVK